MVTEAGGRASELGGAPLELPGAEIFASNGLVHDTPLKVFSGGEDDR